jgi:hypothetical protein
VRKRGVVIGNVIEEVDLVLLQQQTRCYRVNRSVSPPLVEETASLVDKREIIEISLRAKPVKAPNFKVGPLEVVGIS